MAPERILVRGPNWIGDQIMAAPFYRGLRGHYPHAKITWLGPESLRGVEKLSFADEILFFDRTQTKRWGQFLALASQLRAKHFDLAISLPASLSSALLLFMAGVPERVGFGESLSHLFLSSIVHWRGRASGLHKTDLYLSLLEFLGGEVISDDEAKAHLRERLIVVAPGASIPLREWPYAIDLLIRLSREFPDFQIEVIGSSGDSKWSSQIQRAQLSNVVDKIGTTSIEEVVALCKRASLVIANDSGMAHLAATLSEAPTIVLFGPGDPAYIRPKGDVIQLLPRHVPCSPCEKAKCYSPDGFKACLYSISVVDVLHQVRAILNLDNGGNDG